MRIVYVGPHADGVDIADSGQHARPGVPVDVVDELAARLLDQPAAWQPAPAPASPTKTDKERA